MILAVLVAARPLCAANSLPPSSGENRVVVQLPFSHGFQFAGYYSAQIEGYFAEAGLDVTLAPAKEATDPVAEVLEGRAQYGVLGAEVLLHRLKGQPVVLVTTVFQHSAFGLVVPAESPIQSPSDLVGRRLAVKDEPRYAEIWGMLMQEGIRRDQMVLVPERWGVNELLTGEADAMAVFYANRPQLYLEDGTYRVLRPARYGVDFYGDCLYTTEAEVREHPERVEAMRLAVLRGWAEAMAHPQMAIQYLLSESTPVPVRRPRAWLEQEASAVRELVAADLVELGHVNRGRWAEMAKLFVKLGLAENTERLKGFLFESQESHLNLRWLRWVAAGVGLVAGIGVIILIWNLRLQRLVEQRTRALARSELRFRETFANLPVMIVEEDFTAVHRQLEALRAQGVTDLQAHLDAHPAMFQEVFVAIRVTGANDLMLRRMGAADISALNERITQYYHPAVNPALRLELQAIWEGRNSTSCELDFPDSSGRILQCLMQWTVIESADGKPDWSRVVVAFSDLTELRQTEARLRHSEDRWELAVRGLRLGLWEYDFLTGVAYFSDRWKEIIGHAPDEIAADREEFWSRVHPDDRAAVEAALNAHLEGRESHYRCEVRLRCKQGGYKWVLSRGQALFAPDGTALRIIGAHSDISERKQAEEALRASEDRWSRVVRATQDGIWEYDLQTRKAFFSDRWKEMIGYAPHEFPDEYEAWMDHLHPEDRDRVRAAGRAHSEGEVESYRVEFRLRCKDGSYKWVLSRGQFISDAGGRRQRLVGSHTDISEQKGAEHALRVSEERYRRLFESNPSPMWLYDFETLRFLEVNTATERIYGYTREELLRMTVLEIRPPEEHARFNAALRNWPSHGGDLTGVWRHLRKDGTLLYVVVTAHRHELEGRTAVLVLAQDVTERHFAEERLRVSEARYRALFESAVEGVYESVADGSFRAVNPAFARMLAYASPAELIERVNNGVHSLYVKPGRRREFFDALGAKDTVTDFESEVLCADGTSRWISENVRAIRGGQGELLYLQGFVSDITERRQAEQDLRTSEERYRVLFEHSPVAIVEYDYRAIGEWLEDLRILGVEDLERHFQEHAEELSAALKKVVPVGMNEAVVELVGARSKQDVIAQLDRIFTEEAYLARQRAFVAIWQGVNQIEGELTLRAVDGSPLLVYYRWWLPSRDGKLDFEWTQLVLVDLTVTKQAEAALAAERERLSVTLRAMAEGVVTTDTQGVVQFINHAAEELVGWKFGGAVGRRIEDVVLLRHQKTRADVIVPVARALEEHRVIDLPAQTTLLDREGVVHLVEGRCAPLFGAQGQPLGGVLVIRDIGERARLENEMLRASKLESVGILAGGIAHDFNNILTVVMGNLTLAQLDSQVMATAGRWLQEAERGAMRARDLTQQLLTFAKGGDPVRSAVRLPEVVRESAAFALHGSKVSCEFDTEPTLWPADADKGQIGQVVQNLVINAVQAMPEGGRIQIQLRNFTGRPDRSEGATAGEGRFVSIQISDTGQGIRPEHLTRIFDPYFTTKQSGSGLGLATVYSIIRKHQGHIEVESEPGRGTTFRFWLPAAKVAPAAEVAGTTLPDRLAGRVLFMDDEETIRRMAQALLARLGFEVVTVSDGAAAISTYTAAMKAGRPFRVVVMDLTVPGGMGGKQAMEELLKVDPEVRAIVSSGYSSDPVLANHKAHGFRGVVAKPYRLGDLAKVMRAVINGD